MNLERVTKTGSRHNMLSYLDLAQRRLAQRQEQVASGKRIQRASDSPAEAAEVLAHRRQLDRMAQFAKNSDNARLWLDVASSTLTAGSDVINRARTLVVQASNGTQDERSRAALGAEVDALAEQLLGLANTAVNGRPVFAGTSQQAKAFAPDGTYLGSDGSVVRAVGPDQHFEVARPGTAAFGTADAADPLQGNAFQVLRAVADAIRAGDPAGLQASLGAIDTTSDRLLSEVGRLGALGARLDGLDDQRDLQRIGTAGQLTKLEDVDIAEAILELSSAEAGYQATLAATSKLLSTSLLDFLR